MCPVVMTYRVLRLVQLQVEQYESRCDTYLNLVGWLIGQSDPMPPEKQANLCLHLADLIRARSVRSVIPLLLLLLLLLPESFRGVR